MFGYVRIRKPELKVKDYETYHGFYCGLCDKLKEKYGFLGQVTLTYDMTFLVILLTSVYGSDVVHRKKHCVVHPMKKHHMLSNAMTDYAADMNMLLSFYKFRDEWEDAHSARGAAGMRLYKKTALQLKEKYPEQFRAIRTNLKRLSVLEKRRCEDVYEVADCFGRLMAGILQPRQDALAGYLGETGYYLGRFIYMMDAYDDLEEDRAAGQYNPFRYGNYGATPDELDRNIYQMLLDEMASAGAAFEKLPCLEYRDILRNILYAGVWNRFDEKQHRKTQQKNGDKE